MEQLQSNSGNHKLKCIGPPKYHLGGDFFVTVMDLSAIIPKLMSSICVTIISSCLKSPPFKVRSPYIKGDHPELNISNWNGSDNTAKF